MLEGEILSVIVTGKHENIASSLPPPSGTAAAKEVIFYDYANHIIKYNFIL